VRIAVRSHPTHLHTQTNNQAAYKNPIPFLRPKADAPFDGMTFNMMGSPYAMQEQVRGPVGGCAGWSEQW
jgi:hypothetical protein